MDLSVGEFLPDIGIMWQSNNLKDMLVMVSVVIPYYNRLSVIGRAVGSVLTQTLKDLELIIVDDGSDDGLDLILAVQRFGDQRIRVIRHQVNKGGAAARNTGVQAAQGTWIAFLDSDDEWEPRKLERQLEAVGDRMAPDLVIFSQSHVLTQQEGELRLSVMPLRAPGCGELIGDYLFASRGWLQTSSIMISRELALRVPFNAALKRHQDYDLVLRLEAEGCRFQMVKEPLVVVHWEDMHQTLRGLDPARSLTFLRDYRRFLSPRAQSGFVLAQIVMRLAGAGRRIEALRYSLIHVRPWRLSLFQNLNLISGLVLGNSKIVVVLALIKRLILSIGEVVGKKDGRVKGR
jgi:glycosyltransferase involved in cell wall biosynthesis